MSTIICNYRFLESSVLVVSYISVLEVLITVSCICCTAAASLCTQNLLVDLCSILQESFVSCVMHHRHHTLFVFCYIIFSIYWDVFHTSSCCLLWIFVDNDFFD